MDFYLWFKGDLILVNILSISYLIYSYKKKIQTDKIIRYSLIFFTVFFWFCFFLKYIFTNEEIRGIIGLITIPILLLYYLFLPVKNKRYIKYSLILLILYFIFWVVLYFTHYYSMM
jgi:hypothetical protein